MATRAITTAPKTAIITIPLLQLTKGIVTEIIIKKIIDEY